jgi:catechol 2,3-dioxygenase-like lactoylglutathione lyase family enzyme
MFAGQEQHLYPMCRPFVDGRPVPCSSTSAGSATLLALLSGASSPKRTVRVTRTGTVLSPMLRHGVTPRDIDGRELEHGMPEHTTTTLINGVNHLTFITADMDRLIAYYQRVFEARVTLDLEEEGLRHVFIEVGPHTVLHPFQIPGVEPQGHQQPMFQRGRLDHFALNAASYQAFQELRRRIMNEGADDGVVIDMGSLLLLSFTDPDGGIHEVVWMIWWTPCQGSGARCVKYTFPNKPVPHRNAV